MGATKTVNPFFKTTFFTLNPAFNGAFFVETPMLEHASKRNVAMTNDITFNTREDFLIECIRARII